MTSDPAHSIRHLAVMRGREGITIVANLCPLCRTDMAAFNMDELVLDRCESCEGVWFDARELGGYGEKMGLGKIPLRPSSKLGDPVDGLSCCNCADVSLAPTDRDRLTMYGCAECHGWFLAGTEMHQLHRLYTERMLAEGWKPTEASSPDEPAEESPSLLAAVRSFFFR